MKRDRDDAEARPSPRESGIETGRTEGYTSEQTLWRAVTVLADRADPPVTVAGPDDDAPVADTLAVPERRYQVRDLLGVGGMGEVRLCRDEAIGRDVAVKTLRDARDGARPQRRFMREVRVQGQLEHPSIVPVYDLGVGHDGRLFFTMRRVRGHTLAAVIAALARGDEAARAGFTRRKLLDAFVRVCLAVDYAHTRGVVHRDLKPENIMLGDFGEVYVLDWGIAKLAAEQATGAPVVVPPAEREGQGATAGTPGFMAPEQLLGLAESQDARTDVYALGAILYELLALRPLYSGNRAEMAYATLAGGADARPTSVAPDAPPELDAVCARATAVDRAARYASARELAEAVERFLDGDRDLARRRELAAQHVERARAALERARRAGDAVVDAQAGRADAMREVIRALAFDPEEPAARALLVRLMLEVPEHLPPAVETEIAQASVRSRVATARFGVYALLGWAATIPFVASLGVAEWRSFALASALTVACALYAARAWARGTASSGQLLVLATLIAATCGALSCWLGPFILTPTAAATTTIWLTLQADKRHRWVLMLLGGLAIGAPIALELLGLVPRSFGFEPDRMVLYARALHLPPLGTTMALVYSSLTFCILQPVLLGGMRDALSAAERKLFLQAWHLRQLAPER